MWRSILNSILLIFTIYCCTSQKPLSEIEKSKLDHYLIRLLDGDEDAESQIASSYRSDGVKQYGVIIRTSKPEELKAQKIQVSSAFGDVAVAHVTKDELRKIVTLPSVQRIESGSKNILQ